MSKPRLFIGSSVEGLNIAYAAQQNLRHDAEVTVWDQGIFELSSTSLDSLLSILDSEDFALFVFSPDDMVLIRGDENLAVRDNVVFELGLFIGRLGKNRCFILIPEKTEDIRIPTDLIGVTPAEYEINRRDESYQAATGPACNSIRDVMSKLGHRYIEPGSAAPLKNEKIETEKNLELDLEAEKSDSETPSEDNDDPHWFQLYLSHEYEKAVEILDEQIPSVEDIETLVMYKSWRARILYMSKSESGLEAFEELFNEFEDEALPYFQLAFEQQQQNLHLQALQTLEKGISKKGYQSAILSLKVDVLKDLGKEDEIEDLLRSAIESDPSKVNHYIELSNLYIGLENYSRARETLIRGLANNPDNIQLLYACAILLYEHFEKKESLIPYNRLVMLRPDDSKYLTFRANAYLDLDLNAIAMRDYKRALELDPEAGWIHGNIGNLYKNRGFFHDAIICLQQAIELNPDSQYGHERLSHSIKALEGEVEKLGKIEKEASKAFHSWEPPEDDGMPTTTE